MKHDKEKDLEVNDVLNNEPDDVASELEKLNNELEDTKNNMLRALAEVENIRKRAEKEKEDAYKYAISNFAKDILLIRDNLVLALKNAHENSPIVQGVTITLNEFDNLLKRNNIMLVEANGHKFDPNVHQAMNEVENNEVDPGTIVDVIQDGFTINDRLLRPALVSVSKKGK